LIDFGKHQEVPLRDLIEEYLALIDPVVDELGSRAAINGIRKILSTGTGADRQLKVLEESNQPGQPSQIISLNSPSSFLERHSYSTLSVIGPKLRRARKFLLCTILWFSSLKRETSIQPYCDRRPQIGKYRCIASPASQKFAVPLLDRVSRTRRFFRG